jgi:DNA polymerase-4/DNA polymerase IV (DinB-like DNA polymerase)
MPKTIMHIDMDAFYAAVEVRDKPSLAGKPLIIGALPHERGVVSTCSYEARKYGVRSAMSIKEAYRLCPQGIYMHPNFHSYVTASEQIHKIWDAYTDTIEYISLDEGFLDITHTAHLFGGGKKIGYEIKEKTKTQVGLTCSVGLGYSMMSAKLGSEEKKPDGYFEIPDASALTDLIIDRDVRMIYGVGAKTAEALRSAGILTVRHILERQQIVYSLLGDNGKHIISLAEGVDERQVTPYSEMKSLGKENTFQKDITDFAFIKDVLLLIAKELSYQIQLKKVFCRTVTLKITYNDFKKITRSKSGNAIYRAQDIYETAAALLDKIERRPIRLAGISLSGFTKSLAKQMTLFEDNNTNDEQKEKLDAALLDIQQKHGFEAIKTGSEISALKRLGTDF